MKNLLVAMALLLTLSCGKDDDSESCAFIGKWCTENPLNTGECYSLGLTMEFRRNGELLQMGALVFDWESNDCETIDLIHRASGQKSGEYKVISVTDTKLVIDIGGRTELIKDN